MRKLASLLLTAVALTVGAAALSAQPAPPRPRLSPHETISQKLDGNRVIIIYGRPYSKDPKSGAIRKIWGDLVPYAKVWRTGSDEATLLTTQQTIMIGDTEIPAGVYTLFSQPEADGTAKLIVNKQIGQWGIDPYNEKMELARIDLKKETIPTSVDQFTMALDKNPAGGGVIKLVWETTQFSVVYTVKK